MIFLSGYIKKTADILGTQPAFTGIGWGKGALQDEGEL